MCLRRGRVFFGSVSVGSAPKGPLLGQALPRNIFKALRRPEAEKPRLCPINSWRPPFLRPPVDIWVCLPGPAGPSPRTCVVPPLDKVLGTLHPTGWLRGKKYRTRKDNLSPGSVNESSTVSPGGCWQQEHQKTGQLSEAGLNILNHF